MKFFKDLLNPENIEDAWEDPIFKIGIFVVFLGLSIWVASCCLATELDTSKIIHIESSGDPLAYNQATEARGLFQITPICLADYNQYHEIRYTKKDLFKPSVNRKIGEWYLYVRIPQLLKHYNKPVTIKNKLIAYNAGISYVVSGKSLPRETRDYIKKYKGLHL